MDYVQIRDLRKIYIGRGKELVNVIDSVSLNCRRGEFVAVFGPNGCGKSTLLNCVSGLIPFDYGSVLIAGKAPSKARIGFVFQNYSESLFPWLSNIDNIAFGLDSGMKKRKIRREFVRDFASRMGMDDLPMEKYPYQCSGGQQQLVVLLRELIYEPQVLLMDEPFASLDYERRLAQQDSLLRLWEKTETTIIFVSHDIDEAIYLADRLILLSKRPACVTAEYNIDLSRPRGIEVLERQEFFEIKVPILRAFKDSIEC